MSLNYIKRFLRDLYHTWERVDAGTFIIYLSKIAVCAPEIIRTKTLVSANQKMRGHMCRFKTGDGITVVLDGEFFGIAKEIYCNRVYFAVPGFEVNTGDYVVDLGAQCGTFTTLAAARGGRVISVEAQSGFIPFIEANLKKNNCLNEASIEWGIIGANAGLFSDPANRRAASHYYQEAPMVTFYDLIKKYNLRQVDFLKVDIEGSEFDLFTGDISWLAIVKRIAMEVHLDCGDVNKLSSILEKAGFEVWLVDNDRQVVRDLTRNSQQIAGYLFARKLAQGEMLSHKQTAMAIAARSA